MMVLLMITDNMNDNNDNTNNDNHHHNKAQHVPPHNEEPNGPHHHPAPLSRDLSPSRNFFFFWVKTCNQFHADTATSSLNKQRPKSVPNYVQSVIQNPCFFPDPISG